MLRERHWPDDHAWVVLLVLGCSTPQAAAPEWESGDPDIVRPPPGGPNLEKLPGPMLGPFDSYGDALIAACNKILSKPHATAGRKDHPHFEMRWRVSSEYYAWIYYTPDDKYVVSKLTDQTHVDPALRSPVGPPVPEEAEDESIVFPEFSAEFPIIIGEKGSPYELDGVTLRALMVAAAENGSSPGPGL